MCGPIEKLFRFLFLEKGTKKLPRCLPLDNHAQTCYADTTHKPLKREMRPGYLSESLRELKSGQGHAGPLWAAEGAGERRGVCRPAEYIATDRRPSAAGDAAASRQEHGGAFAVKQGGTADKRIYSSLTSLCGTTGLVGAFFILSRFRNRPAAAGPQRREYQ